MAKQTKVITKRRKFQKIEIPLTKSQIELIGNSSEEVTNKTIKLDLTRQLKGKSIEATFKTKIKDEKLIAFPIKIKLLPYFIRRMIRKRISYVEDSIDTPSQESMITIKPFLITRKKVSRAVRKTLRNKCRNWLEDYLSEKTDSEIFKDVLSNKIQKNLSLILKKTYPLSLCEIRVLQVGRKLKLEEIPEIKKKEKTETIEDEVEVIDQLAEIEQERIKKAESEIEQTQKKAETIEKQPSKSEEESKTKEKKEESKNKKTVKKSTKKAVKKSTKKAVKKSTKKE